MGFTPWFEGDRKSWDFQIEPDSGTFDITGLAPTDFTLKCINQSNHVPTIGTGTFSNLQAASGSTPASIQYAPSASDVGTPGIYEVRLVVKAGTASQQTFSMGIWECEA